MNHLQLLKEYIDAKADYDLAGLSSSGVDPRIMSRYVTAERALSQEIEMVEFERIERQEKLLLPR